MPSVSRSATLLVVAASALLAACSSDEQTADITKLSDLKSFFGPEYHITDIPKTGINPRAMSGQKLPDGVKFDPPDCGKFAGTPQIPSDVKGNMAALTAEGNGNRFITIALETNEPIEVTEPSADCKKITFTGEAMHGVVESVPTPQIDGVHTLGVHRTLEFTKDGKPQTGELYSYRAYFGKYQVMVTANPMVVPDKPVAPVDTERAENLLKAAVAAIRGTS